MMIHLELATPTVTLSLKRQCYNHVYVNIVVRICLLKVREITVVGAGTINSNTSK